MRAAPSATAPGSLRNADICEDALSFGERETMSPPVRSASHQSQIAKHPVASAAIAVLIIATIFFSVYVPLYATPTPKVGAFPFFYFYLLVYMPAVAIVLGIVLVLQRRVSR
jgi:hypothetical protein